jgi:hypothetical protein
MARDGVKFGLTLPSRGVVIGATTVAEMLQLAADAWDSVWVGDSIFAKPRLGKKVALGAYSVPVEVGIGAKRAPGGTAPSHPVSALRDSRRHSSPACGKAQFKGLRGSYARLAMMLKGGRDTRRISQGGSRSLAGGSGMGRPGRASDNSSRMPAMARCATLSAPALAESRRRPMSRVAGATGEADQ